VRIVLDTNVVLSALLWRGTPYRLLQAIRRYEHVQLFTSAALLKELGEVLVRPVPAKRLAMIGLAARQVLADYIETIELVTPTATPFVVAADRDDDHVIAAAVAAQADLLVSGDRHLLMLGSHQAIRIVPPVEAIVRIGG
jgi:putative PIN family toxin of toxin-antitoxin system